MEDRNQVQRLTAHPGHLVCLDVDLRFQAHAHIVGKVTTVNHAGIYPAHVVALEDLRRFPQVGGDAQRAGKVVA